jgi:predicted HD phosphohydrolase
MKTVSYTKMTDATPEDFELLRREGAAYFSAASERILAALETASKIFVGHQISVLEHMLQTATRAARDGADDEMVVAALLHDFGDLYAPNNHSEFAAALIRPFVREEVYWIVRHHGIFQLYYHGAAPHWGGNRRERYRASPYYDACIEFCERWDQTSFDPAYRSMPLAEFAPIVRQVLARPPHRVDMLGAGELNID